MALLTEDVAREAWEHARARLEGRPRREPPLLLLLAGVPLSGKSTLAQALAASSRAALLVVETDALRLRIAERLGLPEPTFDGRENFFTHTAARLLTHEALSARVSVVHDATNLDERARRPLYATADQLGAQVLVALVTAPAVVRDARAATLPPLREGAHRKLGLRQPNPEAAARPLVVLDGTRPARENVARLATRDELAGILDPAG